MHIRIINGPNLDLLGTREPATYGTRTFEEYLQLLQQAHTGHVIDLYQSLSLIHISEPTRPY